MKTTEMLIGEFDHEMKTTRSLLERVPEARADWKPHAKSYSLGELAVHVAGIPGLGTVAMTHTEYDARPAGGGGYKPSQFESTEKLLAFFDENVRSLRAALTAASDEDFATVWTLKAGGHTIFALPRLQAMRSFVMNHHIHHRGQLSVYLRLLDVPLPSIYGPTADMT